MAKCNCEVCQDARKFSEIVSLLPQYRDFLNDIWCKLEDAQTTSIYYRERYQGTWPSQDVDHENEMHAIRIKNIQERTKSGEAGD